VGGVSTIDLMGPIIPIYAHLDSGLNVPFVALNRRECRKTDLPEVRRAAYSIRY
jgi:hypothetical protein